MDTLSPFLQQFLALIPAVALAAPLIAFIVDTAKRFGLENGYAPLLSGALNLAAYAFVFFATDAQQAQFSSVSATILAVGPTVLALFVSLLGTKSAHDLLANIGIGFSHTVGKDSEAG